jgi:hypothetical protein
VHYGPGNQPGVTGVPGTNPSFVFAGVDWNNFGNGNQPYVVRESEGVYRVYAGSGTNSPFYNKKVHFRAYNLGSLNITGNYLAEIDGTINGIDQFGSAPVWIEGCSPGLTADYYIYTTRGITGGLIIDPYAPFTPAHPYIEYNTQYPPGPTVHTSGPYTVVQDQVKTKLKDFENLHILLEFRTYN